MRPEIASRRFRFGLLFALSLTEMMPVMFIMQAMPVVLRRHGASLDRLSSLYVVMAPWTLKFLWAQAIDRFGSRRVGRYRSWLLLLHPLLVAILAALALSDFERLVVDGGAAGLALLLGLSTASATADIAAHGLAVNLLEPEERGTGNAVQGAGMLAGYMLGGGVMLMLLERFGWRSSLLAMAAVVVLPMIAVWAHRERPLQVAPPGYRDALAFFRLRGVPRWLVAMALLTVAHSIVNMPLHAALADRGLDLAQIGFLTGIVGSVTGIAGGAVAGGVIQRYGRKVAFYGTAAASALGMTTLPFVTVSSAPLWGVGASVGIVMAAWMALATVHSTMMMDRARPSVAGSDYTVQHGVGRFASLVGGAAGSLVAASVGGLTLFVAAPLVMLLASLGCVALLRGADFQSRQHTEVA